MNQKILKLILLVFSIFLAGKSIAETQIIDDLTIKMIRNVGDYHLSTTYDNTIELWFTNKLVWNSGMNCTNTDRIYINANNEHMVSAAYLAFASGKKVNIFADDTLPVRTGSCEISYIDILY